jgi:phage I-like protein
MTPNHTPLSPVLMAADPTSTEAPDWIHLLPPNGYAATDDKRGPYSISDPEAIIALSFSQGDRLPIDQDHATDLAAPKGLPAPARGWITAMEARTDGVWGKVEWTREGAAMVADRAYRAISPVIVHDKAKRVVAILRASLVNRPNLKGLVALNATQDEEDPPVNPMEQTALALGLQASASVEDVLAAIGAMKKPASDVALQTALQTSNDAVTALQATVSELTTQLNSVTEGQSRSRAETFIDGAITKKHAGLNAGTRDYFIALHMANPAETEAAIAKMPQLGPIAWPQLSASVLKDGEVAMQSSHVDAARLLGLSAKEYAATLKAEAEKDAR